jgi:hypothetical protein
MDMSEIDLSGVRTDGDERLAELLLFIAKKSEGDRRFGAVKLNKIIFFG